MQLIFLIAIIFMMVREVIPFGDIYVLRVLSQGMCLLVVIVFFTANSKRVSFKKYLPLLLYILSEVISAILSKSIVYASLQIISFGAVTLFFIAYNNDELVDDKSQEALKIIAKLGVFFIGISLLLMKLAPAYASYYNKFDGVTRLRGLFQNPETLAYYAAIIWGLVVFTNSNQLSKNFKIITSLICLPALLLAMCRTFWVAWFVASIITFCIRSFSKLYLILGIWFTCLCIILVVITGVKLPFSTIKKNVRIESITNLSGRIYLWEAALERLKERPLFGHGLGSADDAFKGEESRSNPKDMHRPETERSFRPTMHNGYIQSLLDGGVVGFIFYLITLAKAFYNLLIYSDKKYLSPLYVVTFFLVANLGQSAIMGTATFSGIIGWYFIIYGLRLGGHINRSVFRSICS